MKTLTWLLSSAILLVVPVTAFADGSPLDGPQGAPDAQTVALAYGDLSVFILNVAAGNDGVTYNADAEHSIRDTLAQPVFDAYPSLSSDDQQSLAQIVVLDTQLRQVWPNVPDSQRAELRDQWAADIQAVASSVSCDEFDALSRARLVPSFGQYHDVNLSRLLECWNQHPELARDGQGNPLRRGSAAGSSGNHAAFVSLMNANLMNFAAGMNIASNIGTGQWSYSTH